MSCGFCHEFWAPLHEVPCCVCKTPTLLDDGNIFYCWYEWYQSYHFIFTVGELTIPYHPFWFVQYVPFYVYADRKTPENVTFFGQEELSGVDIRPPIL